MVCIIFCEKIILEKKQQKILKLTEKALAKR